MHEIRGTHVPARYGANLFALRAHHRLLVGRLASLEGELRIDQALDGPAEEATGARELHARQSTPPRMPRLPPILRRGGSAPVVPSGGRAPNAEES